MPNHNRESTQVTVPITVEVDNFWIEYCTEYNDLFYTNRCGYWLRGIDRHSKRGWLCFESGGEIAPGKEPFLKEAKRAWRKGESLPPGFFLLNKETAIKAWVEASKYYGVNWYDDVDAGREDVAIQLALLGEVRYG